MSKPNAFSEAQKDAAIKRVYRLLNKMIPHFSHYRDTIGVLAPPGSCVDLFALYLELSNEFYGLGTMDEPSIKHLAVGHLGTIADLEKLL